MYEIERKYSLRRSGNIISVMERITPGRKETYSDIYFSHPELIPEGSDRELRIRRISSEQGEEIILTYKREVIDTETQSKTEYEVVIQNPDEILNVFEALGFKETISFRKHCINWSIPKVYKEYPLLVTYVKVPEIEGEFIEIELCVPETESVAKAKEEVDNFAEKIGLHSEELTTNTYTGDVALARTR